MTPAPTLDHIARKTAATASFKEAVARLLRGDRQLLLHGLPRTLAAFLLASIQRSIERPLLVVAADENGAEQPRARVTLATGLPEETCRQINLGYTDPAALDIEQFADREDEGILLVRQAGERLYHLRQRPAWADGAES